MWKWRALLKGEARWQRSPHVGTNSLSFRGVGDGLWCQINERVIGRNMPSTTGSGDQMSPRTGRGWPRDRVSGVLVGSSDVPVMGQHGCQFHWFTWEFYVGKNLIVCDTSSSPDAEKAWSCQISPFLLSSSLFPSFSFLTFLPNNFFIDKIGSGFLV